MPERPSGEEIAEFLSKKGAIGLLKVLGRENGLIVEDIHSELNTSRQPVTERIHEARQLNIIQPHYLPDDHGNADRYVLTGRGQKLYVKCLEQNVFDSYERFKAAEADYNERRSEIIDWLNSPTTMFESNPALDRPEPSKIPWKDTETWGADDEENP